MANPTTNFGWQMPTSTDLVTDLPADFATFGQAVDTTLAELKGGTTGQILSKSSATDMDFTWVTSAGDIEGVTAGTGISGGGTSGTVTITNSMATAITTNGDLLYGTGSGTFSRLGIGSSGQTLTVSSGVPAWATPAASTVGFTLLSTTGLSGATTTISGISGQQTLHLLISGATSATAACSMTLQFNSDTAGNYGFTANYAIAGSTYAASNFISNANPGDTEIPFGKGSTGGTYMDGNITIFGAKSTSSKVFTFAAGGASSGGNSQRTYSGGGFYKGTSAITSINIKCSGGTFNGGTAYLYGSSN